MSSTIEKGLDFTLGVAVITAEALDQVINSLVEKGKVARENAPAVYDAVMERGRPAREQLIRAVKEDVLPQLKLSGSASRDEIRSLEERVAALEKQVGATETVAETPEATAGEPVDASESQVQAEVGGAVGTDTVDTDAVEAYADSGTDADAPGDVPDTAIETIVENERTGDASA